MNGGDAMNESYFNFERLTPDLQKEVFSQADNQTLGRLGQTSTEVKAIAGPMIKMLQLAKRIEQFGRLDSLVLAETIKSPCGNVPRLIPGVLSINNEIKNQTDKKILIQAIEKLLKNPNLSKMLYQLCHGNDIEAIKLMLDLGANPNYRSEDNPFCILLQLVPDLAHNKDKNPSTNWSMQQNYYSKSLCTPLHAAIRAVSIDNTGKALEVIDLLLKAGAKPDQVDHDGKTALQLLNEFQNTVHNTTANYLKAAAEKLEVAINQNKH
ncbi:MAG: hypothetical protein K0S74_336 [Chlamydiales bacterium]|jgi:hypothetical protein|nr:hypothetical protein [Chlamydiales bacterium]